MRLKYFIALALLLSVSATAPTNALSTGRCTHKMDITSERFSVIAEAGMTLELADIGCAVVLRKDLCANEQFSFDDTAVVHDYLTGETMAMRDSFFVISDAMETPLKFGIAAYKDKAAAEEFAAKHDGAAVYDYLALMELNLEQ